MTLEPARCPADLPHRAILQRLARKAMLERGLLPDFGPEALAELDAIRAGARGPDEPAGGSEPPPRDLRDLPWASIDNDDSRDLDQLTVAQAQPGGAVRILVAVADVAGTVRRGTALDEHARHNTTSVYTPARVFTMLPEALSTDLTSLNCGGERPAIVVDLVIAADGTLRASGLYRARVLNHAKLAYDSLAAWLEGDGGLPEAAAAVPGLEANLRLQDEAARRLKQVRHAQGALSLETLEARPVFMGDQIQDLALVGRNRARTLIEDFMIAANGVTARYTASVNFPSIRRVVRSPRRWGRIVALAGECGVALPEEPDARALEAFLARQKTADPQHFPDLSLAIIKLMGPGEYVALRPGERSDGHFGLAVKDYTHATAPNRRYCDLVTQRLLRAGLAARSCPYTFGELDALARHCTQAEDAADKVERQVGKSAAALLLQARIGATFDAIVTGAAAKGTWARLLPLGIEGRLVEGCQGQDVGARLRVRLVSVDVERGFIDLQVV